MLRLLPVGAAIASVAAASTFALSATDRSPAATASPTPTASSEATDGPTESPTPRLFVPVASATSTPAPQDPDWTPPSGYTGTLRYGDWVQVSGSETCLNVRVSPGLVFPNVPPPNEVPTLNCLPDGFIGQLSFGPGDPWGKQQPVPVQADGYWWWYIVGQGWVAENWLAFVSSADASPYPQRPELANAGLIAFMRSDGVWLAGADGSSPHPIYAVGLDKGGVSTLDWSPDGQLLAVGMYDPTAYAVTRILDLNGTVIQEYPGLSEASFSPGGGWLAGLRVSQPGDLGGYQATPVVLNRATDDETAVGPGGAYFLQGPQWSPDGQSVTYICIGGTSQYYNPDGTYTETIVDCGGDGIHVVSLADGSSRVVAPMQDYAPSYLAPTFSPDGTMIAASIYNGDCDGYVLIDVATATREQCFSLPALANFGGGCGGSSESGASDWSPDGTTLAYHWQFRAGQNGVALVDVATGERRMILVTGASNIDFSGDGQHLTFASAGYIWTADSDATDVTRLTDGWLPAWQPQQS